ncbi:copper amine oxidase N-terminal domain-containing protein [Paenibacillus sp. YN15]|uniref:copper amine oxidase N-terminal domain-containing protein n=1 Tax=Paenibacillus sp. YN15 TaxID=1742774 RepID=UPI000DCB5018|nr:copper amine oxidase N-terminal domain-containing protein [Paenibacillus sp. YN15]RAV00239.1 hypothetical protein DQG13_14900 [Paenibacillus sp. YN15]
MGKKGIVFLVSCAMLFSLYMPAAVKAAEATVMLKLDDANATVGDKAYLLQSPPVLVNNVALVPLRFIGDALGASTVWDGDTQTVTMTSAGSTIVLSIGSEEALVNNQPVILDQPAAIRNETTMVPLRFIAEALGQTVAFNQELQTITLSKHTSASHSAGSPQKLSSPTVDNLIPDPEAGKAFPYATTRLIDVAVDKKGSVYSLQKDPNTGYMVKKVEPEIGRTNIVFHIDAKLNFEYDDIMHNSYFTGSTVLKKTFVYSQFYPTRLYYNRDLDQMYVLDGGLAYSLEPEVKLATHPFTLRAMLPHDVDYFGSSMGKTFFSPMFETVDGETFYWGGDRVIYSSLKGGGTQFVTKTFIESNSELISTVNNKTIYTYEMRTGIISQLTDTALKRVAEVPIEGALNCIGENGNFYVMTADKIYKITLDGSISILVDRKELTFNKGLYKGKGKDYEPIHTADPANLSFYTNTRFTVDEKDNVILIDESSRMIRRINVYQE